MRKSAPLVVAAPDSQPASDSTVVDQANGGMLAPDEATADDDATVTTPATGDDATTTTTDPVSDQTSTSTTSSSGDSTTSGSTSGPDGSLTGSDPPSAQGATAPGAEKTPS